MDNKRECETLRRHLFKGNLDANDVLHYENCDPCYKLLLETLKKRAEKQLKEGNK